MKNCVKFYVSLYNDGETTLESFDNIYDFSEHLSRLIDEYESDLCFSCFDTKANIDGLPSTSVKCYIK